MKLICLISPMHISYNPRLVKEADALSSAGYQVRVVAMNHSDKLYCLDKDIAKRSSWDWETVDARRESVGGKFTWLKANLRCKTVSFLRFGQNRTWGIARAYSRYYPELAKRASSQRADLFKAHLLPALPAAVTAARRWNAKIGFDAEDFHSGEIQPSANTFDAVQRTRAVEERFIPLCHHLTAASQGIAEAYAAALSIPVPPVVLNAFRISDRLGDVSVECLRRDRQGFRVSLYWYSATIGMDRGLQDVLVALGQLPQDVGLCIRGTFAKGAECQLQSEIERLGLRSRVRLLAPVPPGQLVQFANQHDVGLALEPGDRPNNRIATSNKLMTYLVAGIAVAATDVPGQANILRPETSACFLYPPGNIQALMAGLESWTRDPALLARAKQASLKLGRERFCWEIESQKLVAAVRHTIVSDVS